MFPLPPSLDGGKMGISHPPSKDGGNGNKIEQSLYFINSLPSKDGGNGNIQHHDWISLE
jgi:hypothetical protein